MDERNHCDECFAHLPEIAKRFSEVCQVRLRDRGHRGDYASFLEPSQREPETRLLHDRMLNRFIRRLDQAALVLITKLDALRTPRRPDI